MTGVWMSDSSGFAVTPPRDDSDAAAVRPVEAPTPATGAYEQTASRDSGLGSRDWNPTGASSPASPVPNPESELTIARGESAPPRPSEEQAKPTEPRIEKYRER
jgi:hypothetical protein